MKHSTKVGLVTLVILTLLFVHVQLSYGHNTGTSTHQAPADITPEPEPTTPPRPTPPPEPTTPPIEPTTPPTEPTTPPDDGNGESRRSDPILTKSVNTTEAQVGDLIVYVLTVTVDGNRAAEDVVVEDTLPPFLQLENATTTKGQIVINGSTVRAELGSVGDSETVTIRILARVVAVPEPPTYTNVAVLTTTSPTDRPENNRSSVTITFVGPRDGGRAEASPTPVAPTEPEAPTPVESLPTPVPATPTPEPIPAALPVTGSGGDGLPFLVLALLMIGLAAFGLGLTINRRNTR